LEVTAKIPLSGGANGTAENAAYQTALDKFESYSFNILGCPSKDATTVKLFVNYAKRMRDEVGANFQTVIYNAYGNASLGDHEGVIEVGNKPTTGDEFGLVYWVAGAEAACAVNKSNTNKRYDGELTVDVDYTQADLAAAIKGGRFMFHNVNGEIRVLEDINSLVTVSDTKGDVFKSNQTIRVCDQAANDITVLFNTRYLGIIPNDADGRIMLWNDICKIFQALESIRAIENFDPETVKVEPGETKKAVLCTVEGLNIVNAMAQLYMGIYIN
ncbi:MAG: phage tail sheath subtilisin-like domain-containing protein, partial [Clostridia bacterium]|nr:phage tail sheath subtilisin-like domain-containing protein [Clostridia bacterium]